MLKKIYLLLVSACVWLLPSSCSSWLDLKPQDGLIQAEFWKNKEQVASAVTGCYTSIINAGLPQRVVLLGELRADMMAPTPRAFVDEDYLVEYNILPSNSFAEWAPFYTVINTCNSVIEFAPTVPALDDTYKEATMKADVAQAKAIRAWMYFYLVRLYRDVPLKLNATNADEDFTPLAKSSGAEVLAQIEKDLLESEADIPVTYATNERTRSRITKGLVNTLQADVYLWMEQPQKAADATQKVIDSGVYQLNGDFASVFLGNSKEGIFELAHGFDVTAPYAFNTAPLYSMFGNAAGTNGDNTRRFIASDFVASDILPDDPVFSDSLDKRSDRTYNSTSSVILKYSKGAASDPFNFIMYRYADVMLLRAEAMALLNRGAEAMLLVKQIRDRAGDPRITRTAIDATKTEDLLDYILEERAREFAFEGKRWFDLLRFAKRNDYKRLSILTDALSKSVPPERLQSALAKAKDPNSHYLPIYLREMNTNKLLVQNPFYK